MFRYRRTEGRPIIKGRSRICPRPSNRRLLDSETSQWIEVDTNEFDQYGLRDKLKCPTSRLCQLLERSKGLFPNHLAPRPPAMDHSSKEDVRTKPRSDEDAFPYGKVRLACLQLSDGHWTTNGQRVDNARTHGQPMGYARQQATAFF